MRIKLSSIFATLFFAISVLLTSCSKENETNDNLEIVKKTTTADFLNNSSYSCAFFKVWYGPSPCQLGRPSGFIWVNPNAYTVTQLSAPAGNSFYYVEFRNDVNEICSTSTPTIVHFPCYGNQNSGGGQFVCEDSSNPCDDFFLSITSNNQIKFISN